MSRTAKSILNSKVALLYSILVFVSGFFSRKVFLEYLGAELLGLNTTVVNLLQFLNLAEMGIGTAIACTLYKPLFEKRQDAINEIISLQGWLYKKIAYVVMGASVVLMCFFPLIFEKTNIAQWYAYATFVTLIFSSLLGYFVNYKQVILSANQEQYKVVYGYNFVRILKTVFQIAAISYLHNGYVWWLVLEALFTVLASVSLNFMIKKSAPLLKADSSKGKLLQHKYPEVIAKIKQLFIHKIGSFVLTQTQPLIIYAFASLTIVAYYGNYMFVILGVTTFTRALFNGMAASVGNLVAEGDENRIIRVFDELYTSRFFFVSVLSVCTYIMIPQFIRLWVGEEYIMENTTVILMVIGLFVKCVRSTLDNFIEAYGLFYDVWAPITEAVLNVGCSVLLGYFYGINGVLLGSLISLITLAMLWKPYFLFTKGLKKALRVYLVIFFKNMVILGAVVAFILICDLSWMNLIVENRWLNFLISGIMSVIAVSVVMFTLQYIFSQGMRDFASRVKRLALKKI